MIQKYLNLALLPLLKNNYKTMASIRANVLFFSYTFAASPSRAMGQAGFDKNTQKVVQQCSMDQETIWPMIRADGFSRIGAFELRVYPICNLQEQQVLKNA